MITKTIAALALSALSLSAFAQVAVVKCETSATRSKASVDGKNLASGSYYTVLASGVNRAQSPAENTVGDEIETDYDSNPRDIRQGATAIASNFIVNNRVTGRIHSAATGAVVARATVTCRAR